MLCCALLAHSIGSEQAPAPRWPLPFAKEDLTTGCADTQSRSGAAPPPLDSRERAVSSPLHASWKLLGNISSTLELSPQDIHLCR